MSLPSISTDQHTGTDVGRTGSFQSLQCLQNCNQSSDSPTNVRRLDLQTTRPTDDSTLGQLDSRTTRPTGECNVCKIAINHLTLLRMSDDSTYRRLDLQTTRLSDNSTLGQLDLRVNARE